VIKTLIVLMLTVTPASAKPKSAEWCLGNGCLMGAGTGDWHKCWKGEPNVCRQWSVKKPK
jgi:hypothetical protein